MSAEEARENEALVREEAALPEAEDPIEGALMDHIGPDARFDSGIPPQHRADDLDFVEMSGITLAPTPRLGEGSGPPAEPEQGPLSFYEAGVMDVDSAMDPPSHGLAESLEPSTPSNSAEAFRAIVEGLAGGTAEEASPTVAPEAVPAPETGVAEDAPAELDDLDAFLAEAVGEAAEPETPVPEGQGHVGEDAPAELDDLDAFLADAVEETAEPEGQADTLDLDALLGGTDAAEVEQAAETVDTLFQEALPDTVGPAPAPAADLAEADAPDPLAEAAPDASLVAAERLLEELEAQPRELERPLEVDDDAGEEAGEGNAAEAPEVRYELANRPARHRSRRHRARRRRKLVRWTVYVVGLLAVGLGGGLGGWHFYRQMVLPTVGDPELLLREARAGVAEGRFAAAADGLLLYARRAPDGLARPDALFEAAHALQQAGGDTTTARQARLERAVTVLEEFIDTYPGHVKRSRAEVMLGADLLELGEAERAIAVLQTALPRMEDMLSQLPILRTLARAFAAAGQYAEAESMYLQAAALPQNLTPEVDYDELGQLFQALSQIAPDEAARQARVEKAAAYFERAAESSGISPDYREDIEGRAALLRGTASAPAAADTVAVGDGVETVQ